MKSLDSASSAGGMGRLSKPPHPVLFQLLHEPQFLKDRQHILPHLLRIDAAHIVMLVQTGILERDIARELLTVYLDLEERSSRGEEVLAAPPSHRGLYMLYEQQYIDRLGLHNGGAAHVARSRNDINATLVRMRLRARLLGLMEECLDLLAVTLELAGGQLQTVMSAFTHLQPAQPTTLAHYLVAVSSELLRTLETIAAVRERIDRCPLGAAAGIGTSFAIDRSLVASLLGFQEVVDNSLDAVASRDYMVPVLAGFASFGTTLTRWATDFQLWASHAYGFLDWPDDLVSTSSIMPQKRNAYVWEDVRGQAVHPAGALVNVLFGLKNTPFSNSVEVSGEATAHLWPALDAIEKAVRLTRLLVANVQVRPLRMRAFLDGADVTMTAVADHLVARHRLSFRTAHEAVGRLVRMLPAGAKPDADQLRESLEKILLEVSGCPVCLDEVGKLLDADAVVQAAEHGGGPAPRAVVAQIKEIVGRCHRLRGQTHLWNESLQEADLRLREAVRSLAAPG